ncbi:DsbA family protein [Gordoniibacillus kamchatkensis]|uniref:DsbA family protein n=1 Tax=Gordoniibacillus kamchatkensis TaxID=1590651 RepID=UPI000ACBE5C6|nr:DsbA family protein [Paenibacillus sp. VKM B-2647]
MGNKKQQGKPKLSYGERKKIEEQRQRKQMQRLIWITAAVVVAIAALVAFARPGSNAGGSAAKANISTEHMPVIGKADAPVKIIEYGDFKCPSCRYFSQNVYPSLKKDYIDTGEVALYFSNFPFIGPDSLTAAYAAQAVYHQNNDAFWTYYDLIYKYQQDEKKTWATPDVLVDIADKAKLGLNLDQLRKDIDNKTYKAEVDKQYSSGESNGVNSTPTLFVNGVKFEQFSDYNALKSLIEQQKKAK